MKKVLIITLAGLLSLPVFSQGKKVTAGTREAQLNEEYCSGLFKSTEGTIIDVDANTGVSGYGNILDWLQGRVAGLQVRKTRSGTSIPVIRGSVPGIYVDEISVSASYLNSLNVNDIAMVKVIKTPFLGGFNGSGGAIAIYTYGTEEEEEDSK